MNEYNPNINERYAAAMKYQCPICKRGFDKPKTVVPGSLILELGALILFVGGGSLLLGGIGFIIGIILVIFVSILRRLMSYKCCPFCGSKNIIKNR